MDYFCSCGEKAVTWIPEGKAILDGEEIVNSVKKVKFYLNHFPYCKNCEEKWKMERIKNV